MSRATNILGRVRATLRSLSNQDITDALVYKTMDDVSRRIAEDTLCLEAKMNLAVTSGGQTYDLSASGGTLITDTQKGKISGRTDVVVNSTNTSFTWDEAFTQTYTDSLGSTVPAYRFIVQEARVGGVGSTNEEIVIVSQTLTGITLRSTSDNTLVRFICLNVADSTETISGAATSGFFRMRYIQLPSSFMYQLSEMSPINRDSLERWPQALTEQSPLYYSLYNEIITFYPTPTADGTYVVHYWKIPTTNISSSVEPETQRYFDTALYYGTVAELIPASGSQENQGMWEAKFRSEMMRAVDVQGTRRSYFGQIQYHDV